LRMLLLGCSPLRVWQVLRNSAIVRSRAGRTAHDGLEGFVDHLMQRERVRSWVIDALNDVARSYCGSVEVVLRVSVGRTRVRVRFRKAAHDCSEPRAHARELSLRD
jgi:hypothetical protein